jgi:intein/homing endonuclease
LEIDLHDESLEEEQKMIPEMILNNHVSIISGVPGSGKSYSVALIIKRVIENEVSCDDVIVVAPTGKAAKRNDELIQKLNLPGKIECMTIHRLLGAKLSSTEEEGVPEEESRLNRGRSRFAFDFNEDNMLTYQYFIIDESSMLDVELGASLFQAIPSGARVIIVGDHYQLPSVGPGSFLRDLMAAGIPSVVLDKPRRNSEEIAQSCYMIKEGKNPIPNSEGNWTHLEKEKVEHILESILSIHKNYISKYSNELAKLNLQVISPEKKGILGCNNLNRLLSSIVNPGELISDSKKDEEPVIRIGDKVVRTKNGKAIQWDESIDDNSENIKTEWFEGKQYYIKECYIVNGDMGEVIGFKGSKIIVKFSNPTRICALPRSDSRISLAYAMTVHKCVHPDTLVETSEGLLPIKSIKKTGIIATNNGPKEYINFVENPDLPCLKINTYGGYSIVVTRNHMVEIINNGYSMIEASKVIAGDTMRLKLGVTIEYQGYSLLPEIPTGDARAVRYAIPKVVDENMAEFLGLMVADGTTFQRGFRLVKRRKEVIERFKELCILLFKCDPKPIQILGTDGYQINSTLLSKWLLSIGGLSPNQKDVPECILRSNSKIHAKFLKGLFEDGWVNMRNENICDHIGFYSCFPNIVSKVRVMLLRLGIISGDVKTRKGSLYIYGFSAIRFSNMIGFISKEKQKRSEFAVDSESKYNVPIFDYEMSLISRNKGIGCLSANVINHIKRRKYIGRKIAKKVILECLASQELIGLLIRKLEYHYTKVESIEEITCPTMCVEVPDGHNFFQNGFPHGNCQGSGFPIVIMPLSNFYWNPRDNTGLFSRELIYTLFSRPSERLITVGRIQELYRAVSRITTNQRQTRLKEMVKNELINK